ncbi:response regulator transcription factor [Bacillus sp. PS06]|uniref:response regulator transcription factor n=1 Tax=Bacillus sp. PS06 TaxID=2764176 RepID=UPI001783D359|nr:response regulator transcription factor [Bacillus sp. PS06]MBD8068191.1 response regulator transcription factor [Bacillus sp. PS06]
MYKVLVVDDERMIREGIVQLIDWGALGLEVIGAKENGVEAFDVIKKRKPEIVITDIMMPEMNGLELISNVRSQLLDTYFIVLSGYGEFDYASTALKYGVKDYILKPCDEKEITEALDKVVKEIKQVEKKDLLLKKMSDNWDEAMPQMKEKFLIEAIKCDHYTDSEYLRLREMFNLTEQSFKLVLLRPEKECSLIERFALKNIADESLESVRLQISTIFEGDILILIGAVDHLELETPLEDIQQIFLRYYNKKTFIAISDEAPLEELRHMYSDISDCLQYGFYTGEGHLITKKDVDLGSGEALKNRDKEIEKIIISIKTGHIEVVKEQIRNFFMRLMISKERIDLTKMYCMELLLNMIQQSRSEPLDSYAQVVIQLDEMTTIQQIEEFVTRIGIKIAESNYEHTTKIYSNAIEKVISYIEKNLDQPNLSLKKIAREILFMNEDYLSRIFQRETGERFSLYVNKLRMEKAKVLLETREDLKMFEVSELTGFGDKNHYFSLAFKKYTGMSPREYKSLFETSKK